MPGGSEQLSLSADSETSLGGKSCSALWSEVAGCSALVELLGGSALPELLGAEEDKKQKKTKATVSMHMFEPKRAAVMKIDFKLHHAQTDWCTYIGT